MWEKILSLMGMILSVVVVCFLAYWVTRRLATGAVPSFKQQAKRMQVYDRIMLGQNKMLVLVRVGERWMLLGVADNITQIAELTPDEAQPWTKQQGQDMPNFSDVIAQAIHRRNQKP